MAPPVPSTLATFQFTPLREGRPSQKHFFTNQTKTAASWGVKIKVKLLRGSAEGDCYIQSVGGNFA